MSDSITACFVCGAARRVFNGRLEPCNRCGDDVCGDRDLMLKLLCKLGDELHWQHFTVATMGAYYAWDARQGDPVVLIKKLLETTQHER